MDTNYSPTNEEIRLIMQHNKSIFVKIQVFNDRKCTQLVNTIDGMLISDSLNVDSESTQRRTYSCNLFVKDKSFFIGAQHSIQIDRYIKVYYGIKSNRDIIGNYSENPNILIKDRIFYWIIGTFTMVGPSYSFSATDRTLSLSCIDLMADFDGTKNGKITGGFIVGTVETEPQLKLNMSYMFKINAVGKYSDTKKRPDGTYAVEEYVTMKNAILSTLYMAGIASKEEYDNYVYDGEYYSISGYDYTEYENVPYDLEFTPDQTFNDVQSKLKDLFSNYEYYFDVNGKFIQHEIPTGQDANVVLRNNIIDPLLISEEHNNSFSGIYNCTEVQGKTFELSLNDRYCENTTYEDGIYGLTLEEVDQTLNVDQDRNAIENQLSQGDQIAFKAAESNDVDDPKIKITVTLKQTLNQPLGSVPGPQTLPLYDTSGNPLKANTLIKDKVYITKYYKVYTVYDNSIGKDKTFKNCLIFSGSIQAYGYYEETNKSCPYSTTNLGYKIPNRVVMDTDYTDDLCFNRAERMTYESCAMQDTITLNMIIIPQLDVNQKIAYVSYSEDDREALLKENDATKLPQQMIKNFSQSTMDGTMSLTAYRYREDFSYVWDRKYKKD